MAIRNINKVNRIKALAAKVVKNNDNVWFQSKFLQEWQEFTRTYGDGDICEAAAKDGAFRKNLGIALATTIS